jgi:hypothetical protein
MLILERSAHRRRVGDPVPIMALAALHAFVDAPNRPGGRSNRGTRSAGGGRSYNPRPDAGGVERLMDGTPQFFLLRPAINVQCTVIGGGGRG